MDYGKLAAPGQNKLPATAIMHDPNTSRQYPILSFPIPMMDNQGLYKINLTFFQVIEPYLNNVFTGIQHQPAAMYYDNYNQLLIQQPQPASNLQSPQIQMQALQQQTMASTASSFPQTVMMIMPPSLLQNQQVVLSSFQMPFTNTISKSIVTQSNTQTMLTTASSIPPIIHPRQYAENTSVYHPQHQVSTPSTWSVSTHSTSVQQDVQHTDRPIQRNVSSPSLVAKLNFI